VSKKFDLLRVRVDWSAMKALADRNAADKRIDRAKIAERLPKNSEDPEYKKLMDEIRAIDVQVAAHNRESTAAGSHLEFIDSLVSAITAFLTSVGTAATGRSPLQIAALTELLHAAAGQSRPAISHVLFLQAEETQGNQTLSDRALGPDKFTTVMEATLTFNLLDTSTGHSEAGGVASAVAELHGKLGEQPEFGFLSLPSDFADSGLD
jgi:hypothetical protein